MPTAQATGCHAQQTQVNHGSGPLGLLTPYGRRQLRLPSGLCPKK
ncbi:hypothetical protein P3T43_002145 [Paraburkholderia sp. GAS41]